MPIRWQILQKEQYQHASAIRNGDEINSGLYPYLASDRTYYGDKDFPGDHCTPAMHFHGRRQCRICMGQASVGALCNPDPEPHRDVFQYCAFWGTVQYCGETRGIYRGCQVLYLQKKE